MKTNEDVVSRSEGINKLLSGNVGCVMKVEELLLYIVENERL